MLTVVLLICSNAFMTIAWYGHLKFRAIPLVTAILVSWSIALLEYCFQVPANRYGYASPLESLGRSNDDAEQSVWQRWWHAKFTGPQLKILQEVITISVFVIFNWLYLKNAIRPTDWVAFGLIILAVVVMMWPRWAEASAEQRVGLGAGGGQVLQLDQGASSKRPGDSR
ncbi:MAG TPA: DMT family protein [Pirellulales bacterium]